MKWAVSPFSANPHSGRRCHLKSMLVSSVHIPKAARRRKFRSTDIETPTAHFGGSAYIKTSKKTKARQPAYTMNRNKSLPQEAPQDGPKKELSILSSSWNHQDQEEEHYGDSAPNLTLRFSTRVYYYGFVNHQPHVRICEKFFIGIYWWFTFKYRGWLNTHENYHKRS